ncbi:MAG: baseplate J/gp47 family protein [Limnobacter sp.]|uniref:baseplate J/gp47 family protein n=1 Tax=Limnobacter sp. TaxID=2003368 RepID=UPI00391A0B94
MPFSKPSLRTLVDRAVAEINARLPGADARLRFSNLNVLSSVIAGAVHGLYGYLDWISRQVFPDTAETENLERWSSIWGIQRKAASAATGLITFTGVSGSVLPAGTLFQRPDGAQFQTSSEVSLVTGSGSVSVVAVSTGAAGNTQAGVSLFLVSPVLGVDSTGLVSAPGISGGSDIESDDSLRARLLNRIKQPPHGGAASDYIGWALEIAGVTRAWVYTAELGVGTLTVRFVRDNDGQGAAIIPDASEVASVQAYLDARRPVTAIVYVVAPVAVPLNFSIQNLTPNTQAVRDAIEAELRDLIARESEPGGTILLSHIRAAISSALGENDFTLVSPAANVVNPTGSMSVMGAVTWL